MPTHVVEMLMKSRGESKNKRSYDELVGAIGENASLTEPDESGIFEIEVDAADLDHARERALSIVAAARCSDHVMLLQTDDLPEEWHSRAGTPRARA